MGGRGWGGKTGASSLTFEQLQSMGVGRGEGPGPTLAPPPLYPKIEHPPLPLLMDASMDYMLILKKQFIDCLHDSKSYIKHNIVKSDYERYSDKYKVLSADGKSTKPMPCPWPYMPRELRPPQERQSSEAKSVKRKSELVDVNKRLKKLEELEKFDKNEEEEKAEKDEKNSSDEGERESEKEEPEDPDEEMDDGTDYVDNYFDNGEAFDEEDDNLDDGPVY